MPSFIFSLWGLDERGVIPAPLHRAMLFCSATPSLDWILRSGCISVMRAATTGGSNLIPVQPIGTLSVLPRKDAITF
jgi:hypothetical protein